MKLITIHGMTNKQPGYSEAWKRALNYGGAEWLEFYWKPELAQYESKWEKVNRLVYELADVPTYRFHKAGVLEGFYSFLGKNDFGADDIFLAHSLGSVLLNDALEFIEWYETGLGKKMPKNIIYFGSPLHSKIQLKFLKSNFYAGKGRRFIINNVYGVLDPIGGQIKNKAVTNYRVVSDHNELNYLHAGRHVFLNIIEGKKYGEEDI